MGSRFSLFEDREKHSYKTDFRLANGSGNQVTREQRNLNATWKALQVTRLVYQVTCLQTRMRSPPMYIVKEVKEPRQRESLRVTWQHHQVTNLDIQQMNKMVHWSKVDLVRDHASMKCQSSQVVTKDQKQQQASEGKEQ
ncbi:uncharacterized protein [Ptychodera flava]|uniref:uncharacterized protein n=1 Tax=Ptychodera flava TaxID=63121 RepID=UPI00396A42AF